ncbi:glycoside hydrolase family 70 protein [Lactiplantibacillus plantarum]|uniref:glycoside hydrolase family 70 protein n=1 Tax=Lactiplantibacillus plantarum TaxID=1590 RepID=UPI002014AF7C|nr:glycoside hydrolase family 70 protein [Lactiplantibacillus plantarum]UQK35728.1 KxYKxGKxW signal peptide domain-containing protein [Lactiplantibacillus plantarum]
MNLRTNNPLNSERAVHYKLYKSGKLWLVAGVTFCSFVGSAIINDQIAHADTVTVAKTATTVTRTTVSADSKTSNDSTQADTVSTTANKVAKTTSNIAHQPNSATNSLNTSQAATATSSTTTKAASSILSQADSETANSNTSQAVTATSSATTEAVSSAANQTGQKVSSSNNKSHEAKAHTTSAASGSISQVSNTAVKSAASTENTNKATSVASSAVNRQATTTAVNDSTSQSTSQVAASAVSKSQADNQIASSTAATPNTKPATQVRLMATSSAAMKIKPITYKIQSKQMTRNQYQWQGNNLYYYGNDGQPITGLRHYSNNKLEYYGKDHVQYRNRYASQGNQLYYFGSNGDAVTGLRHYGNNKLEYYGTDHVQYRNRYASQGNQLYYFGSNGDAVTGLRHYGNNKLEYYGKDHVQYRNRYASQGNQLYYFGSNGDAVTGLRHYGNNKLEYYGTDHVQYRNRYASQGNQLYYFGSNGDAVTGLRHYGNNKLEYYGTDHVQYRNRYASQGNQLYYFGSNGDAVTGLRHYGNNKLEYYGTDHVQYRNRYASQGNQLYYFGSNGDAVTGLRHYGNNKLEYYGTDHVQYRNRYASQGNQLYYFGSNGDAVTGLRHYGNNKLEYYGTDHVQYRNRYASQGNQLYYFGSNGDAVTGLRHYGNNKLEYYGTDHVQYRNRYASQGNQLYYFGSNGDAVTGLRHYGNNKLEYYGTDHVQYRNRYASQGNQLYYFGSNGDAVTGLRHYGNNKLEYYGKDHVQYRNRYASQGNQLYYFGSNGDAVTGLRHYGNNKLEYYGTDHVQYRNRYASQGNQLYYFGSNGDAMVTIRGAIENGKFNIYDMRTNRLIKSLDAGTWENLAYSMDANSINNVDGYLSYSGWYRPIGTSQDGKTWYKTGAGDWRPILMYAWPNKDVQAQFIKYFVNHGYENANYRLTKVSVANLNKDTDATVLNTAAQNLRYVIEQSIATNKGTGKLANDINGFAATVPELSASSELSLQSMPNYKPDKSGTVDSDQVIFVNDADSKYRLMNRTINNQTGNDNSDNSPELLVGNDIDNSNPVVQAENLNWEYFLLNYGKLMGYNQDGNFDGFRIDAADNIDADVLDQMGQLMNDMYHMKGNPQNANNHLSYNEGYHSGAAQMLNKKGNPQLYMDSREFYTLENVLGRANNRDTISDLVTNSIVNRQNDVTENEATPNWSFVTNHDQRKNLINRLIIRDHPGIAYIMGSAYKAEYANQAWQEFYADQKKTDKQYAQYNVPAQYAILLSNKDTVPQIYYGDLYNETAQYMQEKSIYYDAITTLMKARKQFVSGGQTMTKLSDNLIASVRYGKGVANANSEGTDSLSRTSGMAVIVGNNPQMAEQTISINMGRAHANEQYRNLLDTTDNGLTYNADGAENPETLTTDDNGILKVTVKGYSNPYVSGYLGVWVPVVSGNQDVTTNAATVSADSNKIFESNAALDSHMIYQDFSLYQPEPTSTENHAYNIIAQNAELFNNLGITDFWMAPAYTPFGMSRYNEGYSMTDRYNLGTNANPTKYGSGEELANAIAALHSAGLKVQEDIVMNQMIGFSGQEAVTVTRTNDRGMQIYVNGKTYANQIYFAYTTGGGNGQETYGGKYLSELQSKYPDLFTTRAISTGVAPDPTTHITKWSAKYENGTSLQNIGIGLAVKLPNGDYAYLDGGNNDKFKTTLPEQMGSIAYHVQQELKN